jgi:hypothetical protein
MAAEDRATNSEALRHDDPSATPTAYVILIFVAVFVIVLFALQAYFGQVAAREEDEKVVERSYDSLAELRASQQEQLSGYRWVNADSGTVAIPIERAMELTARQLAENAR